MLQKAKNTNLWPALIIGLALMITGLSASAEVDPPDRVGRLSYVSGTVQIYNRDDAAWENISINRPVTTGDAFYSAIGSRAEIRIGTTAIRLDGDTELQVVQLDDANIKLQLDQGHAAVRLVSSDDVSGFSLNTPEGQLYATQPGSYSFDNNANSTSATAWSGMLQFQGRDGTTTSIQSVNRAEFQNDNGVIRSRFFAPIRDDFHAWVSERIAADERAGAPRYVSAEMTGAEDLQNYGGWESTADYGPIWYPSTVVVGWAPYRYGHWAWVGPWGWTWVDDAPWGFAPFHYGRWVQHHDRWGWAPGRYVARPVYAPALVAWVGGSGFSVSISSGPSVGWFPLGPREVYVPSYRVSPRYVRNVNYTHVTNITNINVTNIVNNPQGFVQKNNYAYRNSPQAVTVVSRDVMVRQHPVAKAAVPMRGNQWSKVAAESVGAKPDVVRPVSAPRPGNAPSRVDQGRTVNDDRQGGNSRALPAAPGNQNQPQTQIQNRPNPVARPDNRGGENAQDNNRKNADQNTGRDNAAHPASQAPQAPAATPSAAPNKPEQRVVIPEGRPAPNRPSGTDVRGNNVDAVGNPRNSPAQSNKPIRNDQRSSLPPPVTVQPAAPARTDGVSRGESLPVERPAESNSRVQRPVEPSPQRSVEPKPSPQRSVEPSPQRSIEPSPQRSVEPRPSPQRSVEPSLQRSVEPKPQRSVEPSPQRSVEPKPVDSSPRVQQPVAAPRAIESKQRSQQPRESVSRESKSMDANPHNSNARDQGVPANRGAPDAQRGKDGKDAIHPAESVNPAASGNAGQGQTRRQDGGQNAQ